MLDNEIDDTSANNQFRAREIVWNADAYMAKL